MPSGSASQYKRVEADIARALSSISKDSEPNLADLARQFSIPYGRLRLRHLGRPSRSNRKPAGRKLSELQEKEILNQSPLDHRNIKRIANQILERDHTCENASRTVSDKWVHRFIQRHNAQFKASTGDASLAQLDAHALPLTAESLSNASTSKATHTLGTTNNLKLTTSTLLNEPQWSQSASRSSCVLEDASNFSNAETAVVSSADNSSSENVNIGASARTSLVPRCARLPDVTRPVVLNNFGMSQVEIVLQQIQRYTDLSSGTALDPEQEKKAFYYLRSMQDKLIYSVGIIAQKPTTQAWQLINEGCQMMGGALSQQSRSIVRLLLRIFGGEGLDRLPELRTCLLRHFASTSSMQLGHFHPLSIILAGLRDNEVLESVLEQGSLILLDMLKNKLDPVDDDEMRFLRLDLCFLLRQRCNYAEAEWYGLRFLGEAEHVHGRWHAATRGFLLKVGDVYLHQKLHERAIETFNDVLQRSYDALGTDLDILGVYAHRNLSRIYEELEDNVTSKHHWKAAIRAALRIWGVETNKFEYFMAEVRESMRRISTRRYYFAIDECSKSIARSVILGL